MTRATITRKGSMAHRPRKRAKGQVPRFSAWAKSGEPGLLGFAGYKAGMTHFTFIDDTNSPNRGNEIAMAGTLIEVPPMVVYGIRMMKRRQVVADVICDDEKLLRQIGIKKKKDNKIDASSCDDVFVLCFARPKMCGFGKKRPDRMMIGVGGNSVEEKLKYAQSILGKEVKASDVFKPGEYVDVASVTKGKGWQGTVKRFGTSIQRRKATNKRRHIGTLGAWSPHYVQYTVPQAGQMGYHNRTEFNKRLMKIGGADEFNAKGGFPRYGVLKNDCILLLGTVGGPAKRLIRLRKSVRKSEAKTPQIRYVSLMAKQ